NGRSASANPGAPRAATSWLFADGAAAGGYQTFLTVLNPGSRRASLNVRLVGSRGQRVAAYNMRVDGRPRAPLRLNDVTRADALATSGTSDVPVVGERPLYPTNPTRGQNGAALVYGRNGTGSRGPFPAGETGPGRNEALLVLNPNRRPVAVTATFYTV